ncbi:hypothetical protein PR048_018231 [Dryococelus australis]|uniref:Uncharacterized protein n=1 Tax=Dryococelus australis TaxID=614101 RepID=A0ABQ9HBQ5_9NEOP|nr:hypothetical protein PR048_018231 [Dryococelus australis]
MYTSHQTILDTKCWKTQSYVASNTECLFCKGKHTLQKCENFTKASIQQRIKFVRQNNFCLKCPIKSVTCHMCSEKHYTLLHTFIHRDQVPHFKDNCENQLQKSNQDLVSPDSLRVIFTQNQAAIADPARLCTGDNMRQTQPITNLQVSSGFRFAISFHYRSMCAVPEIEERTDCNSDTEN